MNNVNKRGFEVWRKLTVAAVILALVAPALPALASRGAGEAGEGLLGDRRGDGTLEDNHEGLLEVRHGGLLEDRHAVGDDRGQRGRDGDKLGLINDNRGPGRGGDEGRGGVIVDPADKVAPVITDLKIDPRRGGGIIRWKTNELATTVVFLSTMTPVDVTKLIPIKNRGKLVFDHMVKLSRLAANTTYYVVVKSKDAAGNIALSVEKSFKTDGMGIVIGN